MNRELTLKQKSSNKLFPVLARAYKSGHSMTSAGSDTSRLPADSYKRAQSVNDEIKAAIDKRFSLWDEREQQLRLALEVLSSDPATCCQLIDSKLTVADFVQGLNGRGPSSDQATVCISRSSSLPSTDKAHAVESSQSTLMTSTSQPILHLHHIPKEAELDASSPGEVERYFSSKNLGVIGSRDESMRRCRDQDPDLITANDTSHRVRLEQGDENAVTGVAADITSAIALATRSAPCESSNFTRLLKRLFNSGC